MANLVSQVNDTELMTHQSMSPKHSGHTTGITSKQGILIVYFYISFLVKTRSNSFLLLRIQHCVYQKRLTE